MSVFEELSIEIKKLSFQMIIVTIQKSKGYLIRYLKKYILLNVMNQLGRSYINYLLCYMKLVMQ